MTLVVLVIVAALLAGVSPGPALIAVAIGLVALDRADPRLAERILGRASRR